MRFLKAIIRPAVFSLITSLVIVSAHAQQSGPPTTPLSKGKSASDELLNDLVKLPEAGASGGLGGVKEAILDTILNRAGQVAKGSEYDLLNRLEIEYGLSEGGLDRYSIWSVQPLAESLSGAHLLFAQGGYTKEDDRETGGGDLVYRHMSEDEQALYGAHVGFDHQWPYHHSRLTFGVDYKTSLIGARASHYMALSDWGSSTEGFEEKPLDGTDIELSGRLPQFPELEIFTRGFHWSPESDALTNDGDDIWGYEVAAEYTPINALTLRGSVTDDNERDNLTGEGTVRLNYRLGMGIDEMLSRPNYDLSSVKERRFDRVRRERTMRVQLRLANAESKGVGGASGDCPNIGDTCVDGSIYAGFSPDGGSRMYTTPTDAGGFAWNNGVFNFVDTAMQNCTGPNNEPTCTTGEANTAFLITADSNTTAGIQPHNAAQHCSDLVAHGQTDWYLPALDELNVLYTNKNAGDLNSTFNETASGFYWSSSEAAASISWFQRFDDGLQDDFYAKSVGWRVRCVRKD